MDGVRKENRTYALTDAVLIQLKGLEQEMEVAKQRLEALSGPPPDRPVDVPSTGDEKLRTAPPPLHESIGQIQHAVEDCFGLIRDINTMLNGIC